MRAIVHCFLCVGLLLGWMAATAAPAKKPRVASKKTTAKSTKPSSKKKTTTAKKSTAGKSTVKAGAKSTKRPARRRSTTARRRVRRPAGQGRPAPERYAEIQRALKQRGYYEGDTEGKWDDSSTTALKRFQADQNLKQDGKIGSLSLIALGLGPKRGGVQPQSPPPQTTIPGPPIPADAPPVPVPNDKAPK